MGVGKQSERKPTWMNELIFLSSNKISLFSTSTQVRIQRMGIPNPKDYTFLFRGFFPSTLKLPITWPNEGSPLSLWWRTGMASILLEPWSDGSKARRGGGFIVRYPRRLHLLHRTWRGRPWSSPPSCRSRCSSSRRMQHRRCRPAPSTRSLEEGDELADDGFRVLGRGTVISYAAGGGGGATRWGGKFIHLPGGVPQHMLLSSMCSTSRPMNQEPRETSSLAYLCNMGLKIRWYYLIRRKKNGKMEQL